MFLDSQVRERPSLALADGAMMPPSGVVVDEEQAEVGIDPDTKLPLGFKYEQQQCWFGYCSAALLSSCASHCGSRATLPGTVCARCLATASRGPRWGC